VQDRVLRDPLLVVSPWFEARRREYQDRLLSLSQIGDFDAWVSFFCAGIRSQALNTLERVERLPSYQQEVRELCQGTRVRGVAASHRGGAERQPDAPADADMSPLRRLPPGRQQGDRQAR